ncbi:MAG: hypothetical protein R6U98_08640 [Pirellulaceae bacterium]
MKRDLNDDGRSDGQWDRVADWLRQARTELDRMLREASRRMATAPDAPFSARAMENMVIAAASRERNARHDVPFVALQSFTVSSGTHASFGDGSWRGSGDQVCGIPRGGPGMPRELVTDITSDAVDTRILGQACWPPAIEGGIRPDPLVVDVWTRFMPLPSACETGQELPYVITSRWVATDMRGHIGIVTDRGKDDELGQSRNWQAADGTLQWDACLGTARSERLKDAVAQATSFDFPDW